MQFEIDKLLHQISVGLTMFLLLSVHLLMTDDRVV